jgi:hypothetical protein
MCSFCGWAIAYDYARHRTENPKVTLRLERTRIQGTPEQKEKTKAEIRTLAN